MSNLKSKVILIKTDSIKFDSLSVIPNSIILKDEFLNFVNDSDFLFDYAKSKIIIINNKSEYYNRLFFITYRVFPCNFDENFNFKDTSLILKNFEFDKTKKYHASANENKFLSDNKFYKNGTISRGFVFGNQRDLSTVSNLNLQLSGKINEEVSIRAAISENNMPIQPEGNTQQIQEFDKVYIELFTDKSGVIMGDLEIKNKYSYFMNMDKKVRGINFYSGFDISKEKNIELKSEISGSLAKGKYNKLKISGIEGSQGPYKLFGANNEIYIIILSGSEKVFIDGKLLIRGLNNDYTIDYNSAEISFTTNNLITKDSRITVEYEYAERNFSRMVFYQTNYLQTKKANFWLNFYSEKDNKNDPLNNLYTDDNKKFLSEIGDSIQNANFSNFKTVEYNSDKILYRLTDSVVGGIYYDSVFVYSTDSYSAIYELYFSYVGANKGNYNPVISNVNGRIYKWTATENGIMQGSYSPLIQLITPKSKLMTSIGSDIKISDKTTVLIEMAISDFDANTYSQINDNDDVGYAFKLNFTQNFLNSDTSENKLEFFINYKMADDKFSPIENYNTVEFERDWNLLNQTVDYQEQNIISGLTFYNKNVGFLQLNGNLLQKQNNYLGKKANFISDIKFKTFQLFTDISYLNTDDFLNKTNYTKHNTILSKHFKYLTIGVSEYSEDNRWRIFETDSLINNSFKFEEYTAFINQGDSSKQKYFLKYKYRKDYIPVNNSLSNNYISNDYQFGLNIIKRKKLSFNTVINYRELEYTDSLSSDYKQESLLSGRFDYSVSFFKNSINFSGFYETGAGFEPKKEYQYIEVQKGEGQFTWIDYNNNNIKELDEFEIAKFADEANFIRIFLPTNEFVKIYSSQLNQIINLQASSIWSKKKGIKGFISMFSDNFNYSVLQKANHEDYIPDFYDNKDIITLLYSIRNNFSFKSKNRIWQIDYLYEENNSKLLLINGFDYKSARKNSILLKKKLFKIINLSNIASYSSSTYNSEFYSWKNYIIDSKSDELNFQIQSGISSSLKLSYKYTIKNNTLGNELADIKEFKLENNQIIFTKGNLQSNLSFVNIDFNVETISTVSYEMLDGLKKGKNIIWSLTYNQKLSKIFQLSLNYNGRTSENNPIIHNGGVQLSANF